VVARKQHLHSEPIAVRDPSDQHLVWCRLHSDSSLTRTRLPLGSRKHARQVFCPGGRFILEGI
jgi:hypothetical protein